MALFDCALEKAFAKDSPQVLEGVLSALPVGLAQIDQVTLLNVLIPTPIVFQGNEDFMRITAHDITDKVVGG